MDFSISMLSAICVQYIKFTVKRIDDLWKCISSLFCRLHFYIAGEEYAISIAHNK